MGNSDDESQSVKAGNIRLRGVFSGEALLESISMDLIVTPLDFEVPLELVMPLIAEFHKQVQVKEREEWLDKLETEQPNDLLGQAPRWLRQTKDLVLKFLEKDGMSLQYASKDLRTDVDVAVAAVAQCSAALAHVDEEIKADARVGAACSARAAQERQEGLDPKAALKRPCASTRQSEEDDDKVNQGYSADVWRDIRTTLHYAPRADGLECHLVEMAAEHLKVGGVDNLAQALQEMAGNDGMVKSHDLIFSLCQAGVPMEELLDAVKDAPIHEFTIQYNIFIERTRFKMNEQDGDGISHEQHIKELTQKWKSAGQIEAEEELEQMKVDLRSEQHAHHDVLRMYTKLNASHKELKHKFEGSAFRKMEALLTGTPHDADDDSDSDGAAEEGARAHFHLGESEDQKKKTRPPKEFKFEHDMGSKHQVAPGDVLVEGTFVGDVTTSDHKFELAVPVDGTLSATTVVEVLHNLSATCVHHADLVRWKGASATKMQGVWNDLAKQFRQYHSDNHAELLSRDNRPSIAGASKVSNGAGTPGTMVAPATYAAPPVYAAAPVAAAANTGGASQQQHAAFLQRQKLDEEKIAKLNNTLKEYRTELLRMRDTSKGIADEAERLKARAKLHAGYLAAKIGQPSRMVTQGHTAWQPGPQVH